MQKFTEIFKLKILLDEAGVPYEFIDRSAMFCGITAYQICYPCYDHKKQVCSAVQNPISYGKEADLIEIMGLLTPEEKEIDMVKGYLTAEDVARRIIEHYNKHRKDDTK